MERNVVIERTQEGKAIARQKAGYKEGSEEVFEGAARLCNGTKEDAFV